MANSDLQPAKQVPTGNERHDHAVGIAIKNRLRRQHRARRVVRYLVGLLTAILVVHALVGDTGFISLMRARTESARLTELIHALQSQIEELRETASALRDDPMAIEKIARGELGLLAPGEQLVVIAEPR